jgi:pyridoxal phosphate enzyme (YggS family)
MIDVTVNLNAIMQRIHVAVQKYQRPAGSVSVLAVSKSHAPTLISALNAAGQQDFGENYLQEALLKISALSQKRLIWHYIGPIQSRKAPEIAHNFSWVHTISRFKEAHLLSQQRHGLDPLQICIQVKLDDNPKKSGMTISDVPSLIESIKALPNLKLRGLMTIPPFTEDFDQQRKHFSLLKTLFMSLNDKGAQLDTLSMGMTHDLEAAIAEGATIVRIGTGIFGARKV